MNYADVSHHQATVDMGAYAASGHDRIILKATGGALDGSLRYTDPLFPARWAAARAAGLHRVAYHFARVNNSGADEADYCLTQLGNAGGFVNGHDVICYDTEDVQERPGWSGRSYWTRAALTALARQRAREFVGRMVERGVTYGWIYSGAWFLGPAGIVASDFPPGWRNLWLSDYGSAADNLIVVPRGWTREQLIVRQYTDAATFPGISGPCDANRTLREWIGDDMALTEDDSVLLWGHDVSTAAGTQPAWRVLSDAQAQAVAARDAANSAKTAASGLAAKVDALTAKVDALQVGGGAVDADALAAKVADLLAQRLAQ